jgi:hypothetical protein
MAYKLERGDCMHGLVCEKLTEKAAAKLRRIEGG